MSTMLTSISAAATRTAGPKRTLAEFAAGAAPGESLGLEHTTYQQH